MYHTPIFNQLGQIQLSKNYTSIPSELISMDISAFVSGIYFMIVQIDDDYKEVKQFVVIDRE